MVERVGNLWDAAEPGDLVCITTNGVVRGGRLVMGAGVAGEAARRWPALSALAGEALAAYRSAYYFHALRVPDVPYTLGLFQTKGDYRAPSDPELIRGAVRGLLAHLAQHPTQAAHLPFPGIGLGRLRPQDVRPLLAALPDRVTVWQKETR